MSFQVEKVASLFLVFKNSVSQENTKLKCIESDYRKFIVFIDLFRNLSKLVSYRYVRFIYCELFLSSNLLSIAKIRGNLKLADTVTYTVHVRACLCDILWMLIYFFFFKMCNRKMCKPIKIRLNFSRFQYFLLMYIEENKIFYYNFTKMKYFPGENDFKL